MRKGIAFKLATLLDEEGVAIRKGKLDALEPLAIQKGQLLSEMRAKDTKATELATIRAKAARNEALLASAIRGVKIARNRIAELDDVRNGLLTYSEDGKLVRTKKRTQSLERKA